MTGNGSALTANQRRTWAEQGGICVREICQRCQQISRVGFWASNEMWELVAGRDWKDSILCLVCFTILGDEKGLAWDERIEFLPVSFKTQQRLQ